MCRLTLVLLSILLVACDGGGGGPTDPGQNAGPVVVQVQSATATQTGPSQWRINAALENRGGPGYFKVEAWALRTSPTGPNLFLGVTDQFEVPVGWRESSTWTVAGGRPRWLMVYSRQGASTEWRLTHEYTLP